MHINFSILLNNKSRNNVNITLGSTNLSSNEEIIKISSIVKFPSIVKLKVKDSRSPVLINSCFLGHIEIQQHIIDQIIIPRHLINTTVEIDFHEPDYLHYLLLFGNKILV